MKDEVFELHADSFPPLLQEIPDKPKKLFARGTLPNFDKYKLLCVVGRRKFSDYGKHVCQKLIEGLSGYPIIVVSGLALGIDGIAHESAIKNNLLTIAVPGSGLSDGVIYPASHRALAKKILENNGCLISEFEADKKATPYMFPQRNRVMAGMCHATLIIECSEKSGTLITGRLAMEYNREVMTVPGSIFSENTEGPHNLIRNGATLIRNSSDILESLGLNSDEVTTTAELNDLTDEEKIILDILIEPVSKDDLYEISGLEISNFNMAITSLELKGVIKESFGKFQKY